MAKSRKSRMTRDTRGAHRNGEQLPSNEQQPRPARPLDEPADRVVEGLARPAPTSDENPDPVFRISAGHTLLYRNSAGEKLCREWGCRLGQGVPPAIGTIVSTALAAGAVTQQEIAFGSHTYWLTVAPAVADGYVNVYARDATDHKRTEEALRQAEQRFRTIFDNTSDGIFLHDLETLRLTMGNKSCLQMLGYTEEEFVKLGLADLHPEADLPFIRAQIEKLLHGGEPIRHDIRFQRKDGSTFFADVSPGLIRLNGTHYALVALKDITERRRTEEESRRHAEDLEELVAARTSELQESETRYRSLYHTIADGIFVMGTDGRIEDVNDSACAQLGYTREELIGMPVAALSARADFHPGEILDQLRATGRLSYETAHQRKDGTLVPVELSVTLVEYRGRPAVLGVARDIAERKRAQEALQFTQFAVDHMAEAAFWMTEDGRFCYVNEAACQALGHSRAELLQMTVFDIDPDFTESLWAERWREMKAKGSIVLETVHQAKDGKIYPVEIRANYLEFGGRAYDCAFARDITEHKHAEEALRKSQALYQDLVETSQDLIWQCDPQGRYTYLNPAWEATFGYALEEMLGKPFWAFQPPEYAERDRREFTRLIQGTAAKGYETVHRGKDGREIHLVFNAKSVRDEHGTIVGTRGAAYDITERKRAEETLQASEARFKNIVNASPLGMHLYELQEDGRLVFVGANPAADAILGVNHTPFVGKTLEEAFPGLLRTEVPARYRDAARHGTLWRTEQINYAEGLIQGAFEVVAFQTEPGKMVAIFNDITERKRAEEALRELNATLEAKVVQRTEDLRHTVERLRQLTLELSQAEDRERKRIADILHEDVQQTLAAAKFHLNLLGNEAYSVDEVREIVEQVKRMLKDAIEKSRNLSHELSPAMYQVDLLEILSWLARHMQEKHGLTVRVEAHGPVDSPSEPLKAFLYKVVQELLFNVIKHAGVTEARIRVRRMGPSLFLFVVDRGCGCDSRGLEGAGGFGLLGIRERVQLLGGRVKIRSTPGAGCRFLLAVPYEAAAQGQLAEEP